MAGTVTVGGTVTTITSTPTNEGGSIHFDTIEEGEYDARTGVSTDAEMFQEITLFLGEISQQYSIAPSAAISLLIEKLKALQQQPDDGSARVYEQ